MRPYDKGNLEKVKSAYRKLCLKWHPDKNRDNEAAASARFTRITAAYHTITTNNFDYERQGLALIILCQLSTSAQLQLTRASLRYEVGYL